MNRLGGLLPSRIVSKHFEIVAQLRRDESERVARRRFHIDFGGLAREPQIGEMQGEAEPIGGTASIADQRHVLGRESVVAHDRRRVRRIEQRRAGLLRKDMARGHDVLALRRRPTSTRAANTGFRRSKSEVFLPGVEPDRVAIYARASTHDQQTLPMQLEAMRAYAERKGWKIEFTVEEVGSGAKELLRDARWREIDVIVVWRLDCWGRSLVDLMPPCKN
jgi:nucleotide-binding universal stress UspA family protein